VPATRFEGRFKDKVVLITGAAGGIGRAAAVRFATEGARVGLAAPGSPSRLT
jgi:NAD(P)-dependent dehydrogenase (short-subunit alcohol dehydrogenase family)